MGHCRGIHILQQPMVRAGRGGTPLVVKSGNPQEVLMQAHLECDSSPGVWSQPYLLRFFFVPTLTVLSCVMRFSAS